MASHTTDIPAPQAVSQGSEGNGSLEAGAVGMEIPVRVHGSQITAVVLETTEHAEPFEEETSTMIVFPRGAVVKLRARVRSGHSVVLTNLRTNHTALCRIVQVNTAASDTHYVKLEFIESPDSFWDRQSAPDLSSPVGNSRALSANTPLSRTPPQSENPAAALALASSEPEAIVVSPAPRAPSGTLNKPVRAGESSGVVKAVRPLAMKPPLPEQAKIVPPPDPLPTANEYAASQFGLSSDVVPVGGAPPTPAPTTPTGSNRTAAPSRKLQTAKARSDRPAFGTLSNYSDAFSAPPAGKSSERTEEFAQTENATSASPSRWGFVLAIACALTLSAAGVKYFLSRSPATNPSEGLSSPAAQTATQAPAAASQPAPTSAPVPVESQTNSAAAPDAPLPASHSSLAQGTIAVPSAPPEPPKPSSKSAASHGLANLYAGDLTARPQPASHATETVSAPVPKIDDSASSAAPVGPSGNPFSALVSGAGHATLPAPPHPVAKKTPVVHEGGKVKSPVVLSSPAPVYPPIARAGGIQGNVTIRAEIDAHGMVAHMKVISGPPLLRSAAMDALRGWKYSPATLDGKAVATSIVVNIRFRLNQ